MGAIILGNSPLLEDIGSISPITIPVDTLPLQGIIVLTNPLPIRTSTSGTGGDSFWIRNDAGYLRPDTISDRVAIRSSSFIGNEALRVNGEIAATRYNLNATSYIGISGTEIVFNDPINGTLLLSDLLSGSVAAEDVSVVDTADYYATDNVEDVLQEIGALINSGVLHTHDNKALLDTYDQTNSDITDAIAAIHNAVTIGTANGLSLSTQELSLALASGSTIGALSDTDWNTFNSKLSATDLLTAIKDLTLSEISLIYGTSSTTAAILDKGTADQYLKMNATADGLEWVDLSTGDTIFEVPAGFTEIPNEIGDINNTNYPIVTDLNALSLLEILQGMLFPVPTAPDFVNPTVTTSVAFGTISPSGAVNGSYIEKGSSSTVTITPTLVSATGPGGIGPYGIADGSPSYTRDASPFTNGSSITYTGSSTSFVTTYPYKPNGFGETPPPDIEYIVLANGTTVYANDYNGANSGDATRTNTYTIVDPIYYGAFTVGTTDYPTEPTDAEIIAGATKLVSTEPTSVSISITTYTGAVDTKKFIVVAYPDSYGTLSKIEYVQGSYANVIGSFTNTTYTHTRQDTTTVTYRIYYALNSYTDVSGPLTYIAYF